jgi:hypothetical protein
MVRKKEEARHKQAIIAMREMNVQKHQLDEGARVLLIGKWDSISPLVQLSS